MPQAPSAPAGSVHLQDDEVCFVLADGTRLSARIRRHAACRLLRLSLAAQGRLRLSVAPGLSAARLLPQLRAALPWLEKAWASRPVQEEAHPLPAALCLPVAELSLPLRLEGSLAQGRHAAARPGTRSLLREQGAQRLLLLEDGTALRLYGDPVETLMARVLQDWCRAQAQRCLPPFLQALARRHGFVVRSVQVRDQRSRWGSCSRDKEQPDSGHIRLNWRAVLLPREDAVFLCLHELCHIRHMNHSPAYRAELARLAPDWAARERRLSRFWQELPWWAQHRD